MYPLSRYDPRTPSPTLASRRSWSFTARTIVEAGAASTGRVVFWRRGRTGLNWREFAGVTAPHARPAAASRSHGGAERAAARGFFVRVDEPPRSAAAPRGLRP